MTHPRDAELSALLDGALDPRAEATLRAELARDGALAARLAELASVDEALRALPARPVPSDLRARLQARLDAEAHRPRLAPLRGGAPASARRRLLLGGAGLAAAAALAALLLLPPFFASPEQAPERVAKSPPPQKPEPVAPVPTPPSPGAPAPTPTPAPQIAAQSGVSTPPSPAAAREPDLFAAEPEPVETLALSASEESELAALADDADVVSVLDLLAQLDELEAGAS